MSMGEIDKNEEIFRVKTQMGLLSDTITTDRDGDKESQEFFKMMTDHTRKIANIMMPGKPGAANKIFHHLILT